MMEENRRGILLESGTNEIEIMKFTIGGNLFGINVAKVREIMISAPVKPMPHAHPAVEGIFKPRDAVLTVVDLPRYLGDESEKSPKDIFIITMRLPSTHRGASPAMPADRTWRRGYPFLQKGQPNAP